MTEIDRAHAAMVAAPEDDSARLQFYARLAETEVFLLLGQEAEGDQIMPEIFEADGQRLALIFDREDRLSGFTGRPAPYAGLSGRALVAMIAHQGIGLGLNLDVAPSAMLIPAEAVDWLAGTLENAPEKTEAHLAEITPPVGLPETVVTGLDRKLASAAGLAQSAYLAGATYDSGAKGHVLAFLEATPGAEEALAASAGEALTFSGVAAGMLDVMFLRASDPLAAQLARVGLRFDLPKPASPNAPAAPGMRPDKPPKLR